VSLASGYLNQVGQRGVEGALVMYDDLADVADLPITPLTYEEGFKVKATKTDGEAVAHIITIYGYLDATPKTESIDFGAYATRTKYSSNFYTNVYQITTTLYLEDPIPNLRVVAVDGGSAEIEVTTWEDFACRWEEKSVSYWTDLGALTLSDAKVICEALIENGDWIRLFPDTGFGSEVKKVRPATGLNGEEAFRTLLL